MNNQKIMEIMEELGLHEGGIDNWIPDNAWVKFANRIEELEREKFCSLLRAMHDTFIMQSSLGKLVGGAK